ncbi:MFS transporter [Virgibacillus phasianinus]|uniref:MFS transporter n=1 Tax=Virgibacillus phasianinus TaxID=2017483 RepID=A0A220U2C7_9BACI|nr:MFS transporter [Virgibacillus phasianinus]ASK62424.1 MFS transporter [Virgibacillus phasianinus]
MRWKDWDRNLKVRLYGEFLTNVLFWMFFPFMAIYFSEHLGKELAGILLIVSQLVGVFTNLIGGYCADKFGRKKMMTISMLGQALSFVCFALANSPWLESAMLSFICFSALGFFGSFYWPASHAMVADVVPEKHRSEVFAVFYTAINISVVIGPIVGGILFFEHRFELLLASAATSFLMTFLIHKLIRETVPVQEKVETNTEKNNWRQVIREQLQDYKVIINDKAFLLFIIGGIFAAQAFMQMDLLLAVYMNDQVPKQTLYSFGDWSVAVNGEGAFGWIVSENGLLVALFTVFISKWMTKYYERNVFVISSCFYGVAMLLFGHTTSIWVIAFGMFVFTVAELMVVGIQESFIAKLSPEHMRGQYFAAGSLRFAIGRAIAPIAIPLTAWIGYQWTFNLLCFLTLVGALMYMWTFKLIASRTEGSVSGTEGQVP